MNAGLTVVAICWSLGALHCFPRSRRRRDGVTCCTDSAASRAMPNQQRTHFLLPAFCLGILPLLSTCPLLPQMVCELGGESKR